MGAHLAAAKDLGLRGDRAAKVRKAVGSVGTRALAKLSRELDLYEPTLEDDVIVGAIPTDWVERFAGIANQLRRDYVIDESAAGEAPAEQLPEQQPADRLRRLKVV